MMLPDPPGKAMPDPQGLAENGSACCSGAWGCHAAHCHPVTSPVDNGPPCASRQIHVPVLLVLPWVGTSFIPFYR
jgi:hypothetical protein